MEHSLAAEEVTPISSHRRVSPDSGALRPSLDAEPDLVQALRTAVCVVSSSFGVLRLNRAAAELFATNPDQAIGQPLSEVVPALVGPRESEIVRDTLADGKSRYYRVSPPGGAANTVWEVCVTRLRATTALVFECRPIPDMERELVERIRESESLRSLARQMAAEPDTAALLRVLTDAAQRQCGAEAALVVQHQGDDAELVASSGRLERLCGTRLPFVGSLSERVSATHSIVSESNYSTRHSELQKLIPEFQMGPVVMTPLVAHDQHLGMLAVARGANQPAFDSVQIQRLKVIADHAALVLWKSRLLEQAQAANAAKASFLATMSHELRTPITALTGYGELLADAEILGPLSDAQADLVERMRSVTHHLSTMIEEVLSFASLEAGREIVRPRSVSPVEIVRSVYAVAEPLARQKSLELQIDLPDQPLAIVTDDDKVRQILVNLIGNAIKFTDHGRVGIALREQPDLFLFEVSDSGIGIAPADIPRLFHPFTQLDGGLTRRHGGTGLGLYISQRLAALLRGRIEIRSEVGQGSVFTLRLPRVVSERA
jgi:signal transduction histidine kinase